jgi:hypothetical protein
MTICIHDHRKPGTPKIYIHDHSKPKPVPRQKTRDGQKPLIRGRWRDLGTNLHIPL